MAQVNVVGDSMAHVGRFGLKCYNHLPFILHRSNKPD